MSQFNEDDFLILILYVPYISLNEHILNIFKYTVAY